MCTKYTPICFSMAPRGHFMLLCSLTILFYLLLGRRPCRVDTQKRGKVQGAPVYMHETMCFTISRHVLPPTSSREFVQDSRDWTLIDGLLPQLHRACCFSGQPASRQSQPQRGIYATRISHLPTEHDMDLPYPSFVSVFLLLLFFSGHHRSLI